MKMVVLIILKFVNLHSTLLNNWFFWLFVLYIIVDLFIFSKQFRGREMI